MKIFSSHRKKIEPKRRFGSRVFRDKVKTAANYKRVFSLHRPQAFDKFWHMIGLRSRIWRWVALAVFLVVFFYLVLSSRFVAANIQVSGNSQISTQQIQDVINHYGQSRLFLIRKTNFFILSRARLNTMLVTQIPTIREITKFQKSWPNTLEIEVTERTPGFALKSSGKYFLVDDEGVIIKQIDSPEGLLVVEDSLVEDFATNEVLPNPKTAGFIISMSRSWPSKIASSITTVKFPGKASEEVAFTSSEGWTVFFDINQPAINELNNLALILSKQIPAKDRTSLAYIDLRLSKWAYYCFKATPCEQQPQPNTGEPIDAIK